MHSLPLQVRLAAMEGHVYHLWVLEVQFYLTFQYLGLLVGFPTAKDHTQGLAHISALALS